MSPNIRKQLQLSNQLSLSHQNEQQKLKGHLALHNKTKTKHRNLANNGSNNKQWINNNRTAGLEFTTALVPVFYWYQIFALDYVVVKTQESINCLALMEKQSEYD